MSLDPSCEVSTSADSRVDFDGNGNGNGNGNGDS